MLNDNLDGTFTIVGKQSGMKVLAIVVSQDPSLSGEPCVKPSQPYVALLKLKQEAVREKSVPQRGRKSAAIYPPRHERSGVQEGGPQAPVSLGRCELACYVRRYLSPGDEVSERGYMKDLLVFPRVRHLPQYWLKRFQGQPLAPAAIAAVVLYLTGEQSRSGNCTNCLRSPRPFEHCIVLPQSAPESLKSCLWDTCASCWFRHTINKSKNDCSLGAGLATSGRGSRTLRLPADDSLVGEYDKEDDEDSFEDELNHPTPETKMPGMGVKSLNRAELDSPAGERAPGARRKRISERTDVMQRRVSERLEVVQRSVLQREGTSADAMVSKGQVISATMLEMEDWEVAPGLIGDNTAPESDCKSSPRASPSALPQPGRLTRPAFLRRTDVAFSNSYLSANQSVSVADDISFHVATIKPGHGRGWEPEKGKIRVCSLAAGKLQVRVGKQDFIIGTNGMFKIRPGVAARVENRLYLDAVLHVSTIECY
jgi:hypothetical protein